MSNEQDHWSIGEVLALLQDEFPEVTISKIRFLESQGLVSPERTPSGYRRFYDADYDRLYWILKQQRDHYLPLRVIRDRLDSDVAIAPAPRREMVATPAGANGGQEELHLELEAEAEAAFEDPDFQPAGAAGDERQLEVTPKDSEPAESGATSFGDSIARAAATVSGEAGSDRTRLDQAPNSLDEAVSGAAAAAADSPADGQADREAVGSSWGQRASDIPPLEGTQNSATVSAYLSAAGARGFSPSTPAAEKPEPAAEEPPPPEDQPTEEAHEPTEGAAEPEDLTPPSIPGSSVALTREQLADQAGCPYSLVTDLEKYGMIVGHRIGNSVLFDSTALTISRLAIEFNRYGIEPRHLKAFRLGAEREVEILTQGIGPTLRANNADTRRRSFETLNDLAELGASLRRILVRDLVAQHAPEG